MQENWIGFMCEFSVLNLLFKVITLEYFYAFVDRLMC